MARRHSVAGLGISQLRELQTPCLCVKLFGVASAVELFLFPCILLAAILFRPAERVVAAFVLLTPFIAYLGLDWNFGPSVHVFSIDEYKSIIAVHAASVATLTAFIGLLFAAILSERGVRSP